MHQVEHQVHQVDHVHQDIIGGSCASGGTSGASGGSCASGGTSGASGGSCASGASDGTL